MKNIEINIKEQDTYEALLPASISNVVYSSDTVNSMFNLSTGSKIDDAFSAISTNFDPLMANLGIVTVKLWDGTPVEGITLDGGIKDNNGNTPITDANGRAVVSTNTDEFTFSVASLWADISDVPSQSYPKTGAPTYINVTMADKGIRRLEVTSSQTIRFSSVVKQFDVFGVGGGGGGGAGGIGNGYNPSRGYDFVVMAYGGGGGYTQTQKAITNTLEQIAVIIGNGGTGGYFSFPDDSSDDERREWAEGKSGGSTSVSLGSSSLISVSGGEGGVGERDSIGDGQAPEPSLNYPSSGGSGGAALTYYYSNRWGNNIPGGQDGSNGGGTGQGTTTREFGEPGGTLYASGGGTAFAVYSDSRGRLGRANAGGEGAGAGNYRSDNISPTSDPTIIRGNPGTTRGSGGGGLACVDIDPFSTGYMRFYGGNGVAGLVVFRWTV